ncbi:MAG: MerR family transcriptional regulator [Tepidisphaeraceae bacterium]
MKVGSMTIGELADAAGLSRRAVRFYVQVQLLDPPTGAGRGTQYAEAHLARLHRIRNLQSAGHSLDEIRQILNGRSIEPASRTRRAPPLVSAELWTRIRIGDGVELSFDARRFSPTARDLADLRGAIRRCFDLNSGREDHMDQQGDSNGGLDASH